MILYKTIQDSSGKIKIEVLEDNRVPSLVIGDDIFIDNIDYLKSLTELLQEGNLQHEKVVEIKKDLAIEGFGEGKLYELTTMLTKAQVLGWFDE